MQEITHATLVPKHFPALFETTAMKIPDTYMMIGIIATYVAGIARVTFKNKGIYACEMLTNSRENRYRQAI